MPSPSYEPSGSSRAGVRSVVVAQAATASVLGLLVGVPLGVIAGRSVWRLVAESLGVTVRPSVPLLLILAVGWRCSSPALSSPSCPRARAVRARPGDILRIE